MNMAMVIFSLLAALLLIGMIFIVVRSASLVGQHYTFYDFRVKASQVAPKSLLALSKAGPYLDVHFKDMTKADPIGQTYYQRPLTSYDSDQKMLTMRMDSTRPTIHFNDNTVTTDVRYGGVITVSDFEYGKYNPDSIVTVRVSLYNNTGRDLVGFHVHDGEVVPASAQCKVGDKATAYPGFTRFGPICYFIHTTDYWAKNAVILSGTKGADGKSVFPLPLPDATPNSDFPLHTG